MTTKLLIAIKQNIHIFYHTRAAPVTNETSAYDDEYHDSYDDDYYDDTEDTKSKASTPSSINPITTTTKSSSFIFNLLDIPQRNNHVIEPSCPKVCFCLEDFKYIKCSNAGLKEIPRDIPTTAAIIDLSHNEIQEIKKTDFAHRSKLQEINLNYNHIEKLEQEVFVDLPRLQRLKLSNNYLTSIHPDTFTGASDLSLLDLSNNSIVLNDHKSFLNQPSLLELNCRNCSWTELYDETFKNTSSLTALRIDLNDFNKKINTKAFVPLKNLIKLRLPELDAHSTEELCNLLKFIDNIGFKHFDVSCYELVLGATYNESLILATEPPYKKPKLELEIEEEIKKRNKADKDRELKATDSKQLDKTKQTKKQETSTMSSNQTLAAEFSNNTDDVLQAGVVPPSGEDPEKPYQVPISQEAINFMLIGLMVISVIGIIIGIICRKDVGGIKTKCCRTKKPLDEKTTEAGSPGEEIPLNKLT
ncbi:toll-like receptor 3 [Lucilia cuprina]|uniref:toll-like receptor 3 n=1 Tax=Lucilia cuprina TaxID=7375 RepID=UPI001F05EC73|nr:toll-like receptor 3 [Lucilia cuprina]